MLGFAPLSTLPLDTLPPAGGKPVWGWEIQFQHLRRPIHYEGLKFSQRFGVPYTGYQPYGWEEQAHQPPHTRFERIGTIFLGDSGTQARFVPPPSPITWALDPQFHLLHPRSEKSGLIPSGLVIDATFQFFVPDGWAIQLPQPPHPRPERTGFLPAALNTDSILFSFQPYGWEFQATQPLHPRSEKSGSVQSWSFIDTNFQSFQPYGWELQAPQPPHLKPERDGAIQPWSFVDATYVFWQNDGWEIQSPLPPHPRSEKIGSILRGDDGTQASRIFFQPYGWELQAPQPPHLKPEREALIARGDDGTEAQFVPPPSTIPAWGWEVPIAAKALVRTGVFLRGDDGVEAQFSPLVSGWGVTLPVLPHPRVEKSGLVPFASIIDATFQRFVADGWEVQPWQSVHPRSEKIGALLRGDEGITGLLQGFFPSGWVVQPWQPPHPKIERSGLLPWPGNIDAVLQQFFPTGWDVQSWQPRAWRVGKENVQVTQPTVEGALLAFQPYGWELQMPQPPHPRPERDGATQPWSFIEAVFIPPPAVALVFGWEVPPVLTRTIFRGSTIFRGDDGIAAPLPATFLPVGWEIAAPTLPTTRPRSSGLISVPGIDAVLQRFVADGWDIQSWQAVHPRPEKNGLLPAANNVDAVFQNFVSAGREPQVLHIYHPRPERSGLLPAGSTVDTKFFPPPSQITWWDTPSLVLRRPIPVLGAITPAENIVGARVAYGGWEYYTWGIPAVVIHTTRRSIGALTQGSAGIEARLQPPPPTLIWGWDNQPIQPPHRRIERTGFLLSPVTIEAQFTNWYNGGAAWATQHVQPVRPRFETVGAILQGDAGNYNVFSLMLVDYEYIFVTANRITILVAEPSGPRIMVALPEPE